MVETLIYLAGVFFIGGLFVLERRCLGQMAVVQPLVVCLLAGWLAGNPETGLWLGVSLQLFSVAMVRRVDWALSGTVAALAVFAAPFFGVSLAVGGPGSLTVAICAVLSGAGARAHELRAARIDGARTRGKPPFAEQDPAGAIERCVYRAVLRALFVGAIETTAGTALAVSCAVVADRFNRLSPDRIPVGVIVPTLAAAVAVSALSEHRLLLWTGLCAALTCAVFA